MQHLFTGHALAKSPVTFREMRKPSVHFIVVLDILRRFSRMLVLRSQRPWLHSTEWFHCMGHLRNPSAIRELYDCCRGRGVTE